MGKLESLQRGLRGGDVSLAAHMGFIERRVLYNIQGN